MTRFLLIVVIGLSYLTVGGCGPSGSTTKIESPRVSRVSLAELVRAYRLSPNTHRYTGEVIQVFVPVDPSRKFERGYVDAFKVFETRSGCVRFKCQAELLDPRMDLLITGVCRGPVHDGIHRSPGVDWYVSVEDCQVTQIRNPASN